MIAVRTKGGATTRHTMSLSCVTAGGPVSEDRRGPLNGPGAPNRGTQATGVRDRIGFGSRYIRLLDDYRKMDGPKGRRLTR